MYSRASFGQALSFGGIEDRLTHHAPHHARAEVIFAVEALYPFHQFAAIETGINDVRKLVPGSSVMESIVIRLFFLT